MEREKAGTNRRQKNIKQRKSEREREKRGGRVSATIRRAQPEQLVIDGTCYFFRGSVCLHWKDNHSNGRK
jgi:hypothetical protein